MLNQTSIQTGAAAQALTLQQYTQQPLAASAQEGAFSAALDNAMYSDASSGADSSDKLLETLLPMMLTSTMGMDSGGGGGSMMVMLMMALLFGQMENKNTGKAHLDGLVNSQQQWQAPFLSGMDAAAASEPQATEFMYCTTTG